jgi:acetyl-CoA acetyltransferase
MLPLDPAKINPLGGAIALGHPLGATGAIRTATLVHGLHERAMQRTTGALRHDQHVHRHRHGCRRHLRLTVR